MKIEEVKKYFNENFDHMTENKFSKEINGKIYNFTIKVNCVPMGLVKYTMYCSLEQSRIKFDIKGEDNCIGWEKENHIKRGQLKLATATVKKIQDKINKMADKAFKAIEDKVSSESYTENYLKLGQSVVDKTFPNKNYKVSYVDRFRKTGGLIALNEEGYSVFKFSLDQNNLLTSIKLTGRYELGEVIDLLK